MATIPEPPPTAPDRESEATADTPPAPSPPPRSKRNPTTTRPRVGFGRPTTLTPDLMENICKTVANGNYLDTAARFHGVPVSTFRLWMKRGHQEPQSIYAEFLVALEQAQAEADVRDHGFIAEASGKDWRAAMEHLRLRNKHRYGNRVEVTGADGAPIEFAEGVSAGLVELFRRLSGPTEDEKAPAPTEQGPAQSKPPTEG